MSSVPLSPSGFLDALDAAGYGVDDIDTVLCTHLHFDHVGWNTRLVDGRWQVTFPKARYLFSRSEWEHWQTASSRLVDIAHTVEPVVAAGQAGAVTVDFDLTQDAALLDLLDRAAAWHHTLAGRKPLLKQSSPPTGISPPLSTMKPGSSWHCEPRPYPHQAPMLGRPCKPVPVCKK